MPEAWLRKLLLATVTTALVAAIIRAMQGDPAPQFAGPSTTARATTPRPALVPAPADPTAAALPAARRRSAVAPGPQSSEQPMLDLHLVPDPDAPSPAAELATTWAQPVDGGCPTGFPVKAKISSGIFHVPGGLSYDRTSPDRCYPTADAAAADGLRAAKR